MMNSLLDTPLECKSQVLGKEFTFSIRISNKGELTLIVDGISDLQKIQELVATKCGITIEAVLPLLLVNIVLLHQIPAETMLKQNVPQNSTVH